jgi:hypothetical protein
MSDKLVAAIDADLKRFASGTERTLDVEDIRLLMQRYEQLQAALEKHHWPNWVPGDGACDVCGLFAEAWYGLLGRAISAVRTGYQLANQTAENGPRSLNACGSSVCQTPS